MADPAARDREAELARLAASGDRAAAEQLLALLFDHVHAVCRRICASEADADDATQDALISIARGLPRFDGRSAVRTWAHRVAANAALDEVRRRGRRPEPVDHRSSSSAPALSAAAPALDQRVSDRLSIDDALAGLAPDFRAAVVLRDVVGMDYSDIAEALGVPIGTVRSRIARGRRQLADGLGLGNRTPGVDVQPGSPPRTTEP